MPARRARSRLTVGRSRRRAQKLGWIALKNQDDVWSVVRGFETDWARPMASDAQQEPLDRHSVRSTTTVKGYPMQPKHPILIWKVLPSSFFCFSILNNEAEPGGREISRFAQGEELAVILIISCKDLDYLLLYRHTDTPLFRTRCPTILYRHPLSILGTPLFIPGTPLLNEDPPLGSGKCNPHRICSVGLYCTRSPT